MDRNDVGILITKSKTRGENDFACLKKESIKCSLMKSICKRSDLLGHF